MPKTWQNLVECKFAMWWWSGKG